jgi:hypothetical protein
MDGIKCILDLVLQPASEIPPNLNGILSFMTLAFSCCAARFMIIDWEPVSKDLSSLSLCGMLYGDFKGGGQTIWIEFRDHQILNGLLSSKSSRSTGAYLAETTSSSQR